MLQTATIPSVRRRSVANFARNRGFSSKATHKCVRAQEGSSGSTQVQHEDSRSVQRFVQAIHMRCLRDVALTHCLVSLELLAGHLMAMQPETSSSCGVGADAAVLCCVKRVTEYEETPASVCGVDNVFGDHPPATDRTSCPVEATLS
jgi:hypothetical protein